MHKVSPCLSLSFVFVVVAGCAGVQPPTNEQGSAAVQVPAVANRPDGEGYAGTGELLVRIRVFEQSQNWIDSVYKPLEKKHERASVELRYLGLNSLGRAVFQRHDIDDLAGAPVQSATIALPDMADADTMATALPANTRNIVLDLRLTRQIRIQGKIIEVVEATASGVVFRLY